MSLRSLLAILIVVFALAAAVCWFMAGFAKVSNEEAERRRVAEAETNDGFTSASIGIDGADLAETLALQSRWNKGGAIFAACAALCQAGYAYVTEFAASAM